VIDGGNSPYKESIQRVRALEQRGINFLDAGVSGGPAGARNGACIMVGGRKEIFQKHEKLFQDLSVEKGYDYMGKAGAGHFVKMVHNGIEYGMMQALAEGFAVMKASPFDLDLTGVSELYNHKSVIESRLVGWLKNAYEQHGKDLREISGTVAQSGEGMWTVEAAKEFGVPVPIIKGALDFRLGSQSNPSYTGKIVSALRNQFGGHEVKESKS
jgi:6-phosphogluconate dehydrogenase